MNLPVLLLLAYSLCFGLQNDKIAWLSNVLRRSTVLNAALECTYCTGFHCGWLAWGLLALLDGAWPAEGWHNIPSMFVAAMVSAAGCYIMEVTVRWIETNGYDPST